MDFACRQARRWRLGVGAVLILGVLAGPSGVQAQWLTQRFFLQPGWNAVYLEVQPEPVYCSQVFTNPAIESVWKWDRQFSTVQFTDDPSQLLPEDPHWLAWLPPANSNAFLGRLYALQGCQAYLVKVASNAAAFTLGIKGRAMLPAPEWYPESLNLLGFPVHTNTPPTFSEFFAFTPEVDVTLGHLNELYKIDANNRNVRIVLPARERVEAGRAYWVRCESELRQAAALEVTPGGAGGLDFGFTGSRQSLAILNAHPSNAMAVVVRPHDSEPAPAGQPEVAGPVALSYLAQDASNNWDWLEFPASGVTYVVAAGQTWDLQLGIRRDDMPPYAPAGTNGALYQSWLEVCDAAQSLRTRVPVVAQRVLIGPVTPDEQAGLWVGAAVLSQVNAPAYTGTNLLETFTPLEMRLIVHVDAYGQSRLLQQAILAWDAAITNYRLYRAEAGVPADADPVRRISSSALPLMAPVPLAGTFTGSLSGTVTVRFDDPTNPFLHRYHPQHDNKDWDFVPYTNAVETYTVQRDIVLESLAITNAAHPAAVDTACGMYRETFGGLRAQAITAQGMYYLKRISPVSEMK